jgi:hypothetical protein
VGDDSYTFNSVEAQGNMTQSSPVLTDSMLAGYRGAVDELVDDLSEHPGASEPAMVEELVAKRLPEPEFSAVLSRLDEGANAATARISADIRSFRPNAYNSASDLVAFLRIILLSQIDSAWWRGTYPFACDADVIGSAELVDLGPLRSAGRLSFGYRAQPAGLPGRARDWVQHRFLPARRPRVAGLKFTCSRPAVIAVVNQIALEFAAAMPPQTPRIWVNSMVRSVAHQQRLRSLGYAAVLPSSHCTGYACDLESSWFRPFDPDNVLGRLLLRRQEAGQINVIDEGRTWHLCVNPNACSELQAAYYSQLQSG